MNKSLSLDSFWLQNSIIPSFLLKDIPLLFCTSNSDLSEQSNRFKFRAVVDQFPLVNGHLNIRPTRKIKSLFDLSKTDWLDFFIFLKSLQADIQKSNPFNLRQNYRELLKEPVNATSELLLKRAMECGVMKPFNTNSFTLAINEGTDSGRLHDSLQMHFIPRNHGDISDPRGGIRRMYLHSNSPSREISELMGGQTLRSIKNFLLLKDENHWKTRLETSPCNPGHLQIVLKRTVGSLAEVTASEWMSLYKALSDIPKILSSVDLTRSYDHLLDQYFNFIYPALLVRALHNASKIKETSSYTVAVNFGVAAGGESGKLIIDIIPRFKGDLPECRGGFRRMFYS